MSAGNCRDLEERGAGDLGTQALMFTVRRSDRPASAGERREKEAGPWRSGGRFDMCHPGVNLLYFLLVLVCSVGCMHPACLGISWAVPWPAGFCSGRRAVGRLLGLLGPVALLAGNLLLVRQGDGAGGCPAGGPLTLESAPLWPGSCLPAGGGGALVCQLAGGAHGG
ncbi:MAG: hypothetical protein ACLS43_10205 [Evtepia gabavorous]